MRMRDVGSLGVILTKQKASDGGLAGARGTNEGGDLARLEEDGDVLKTGDVGPGRIREGDMIKFEARGPTFRLGSRNDAVFLANVDFGLALDCLPDLLESSPCIKDASNMGHDVGEGEQRVEVVPKGSEQVANENIAIDNVDGTPPESKGVGEVEHKVDCTGLETSDRRFAHAKLFERLEHDPVKVSKQLCIHSERLNYADRAENLFEEGRGSSLDTEGGGSNDLGCFAKNSKDDHGERKKSKKDTGDPGRFGETNDSGDEQGGTGPTKVAELFAKASADDRDVLAGAICDLTSTVEVKMRCILSQDRRDVGVSEALCEIMRGGGEARKEEPS